MPDSELQLERLEVLFLDAGNTLVSMDTDLLCEQLSRLGLRCDLQDLTRAEAAARPAVSRRIASGASPESLEVFTYYLEQLLRTASDLESGRRLELARRWAAALRSLEHGTHLWSRVLPGVRETLATLRQAGLVLVVVSNSNGSIERVLQSVGLRPLLDAVVDSQRVGFEKPDRRIFLHALAQVRARPEHTLHVGDLYAVDFVGARAAGIQAVLLDPYSDWTQVDCPTRPDLASLGREILATRGR